VNFLRIKDIIKKLQNAIDFNIPFSHIRFGDGGLKFVHSVIFRDTTQLRVILDKEGIPPQKVLEIFELWGYYARRADCIDTPEVYLSDTFWPRVKSPGKSISKSTERKLRMWRDLYSRAEFDNETYCNPESNYLMILREVRPNIIDLLKNSRVCMITNRKEIKEVFPKFSIDIVPIVGQWEQHYLSCYHRVVETIKRKATDYDFWLLSAGEIGRIYTGMIKECGGRALDMGFVIDYWVDRTIHSRFLDYMRVCFDRPEFLTLTWRGKKYLPYI